MADYVKVQDFTGSQKNSNNSITYTYIIRVYELSYNQETNKHKVRYEAILKQDSSADGFLIWGTGVKVTRNGTAVINSYEQRDCSGTKEHLYEYYEEELEGNEDGTLSITIGGECWQNEPTWGPSKITISNKTFNFTTILRGLLYAKINGVWKHCTPYIKINGVWKRAYAYVKQNGSWKMGK